MFQLYFYAQFIFINSNYDMSSFVWQFLTLSHLNPINQPKLFNPCRTDELDEKAYSFKKVSMEVHEKI